MTAHVKSANPIDEMYF